MLEKQLLWNGRATMRDAQRGAVYRDETAMLWANCCAIAGGQPRRLACVPVRADDETVGAVAANLAVHLAGLGHSTWLLDADVRTPRLSALREPDGLTLDVVVDDLTRLDDILPIEAIGPLYVLTSGRAASPAVALRTGERIPELLDRLRERAEHVVVSAPPVVGSPEASTFLGAVDGVVLVSGALRDRTHDARKAIEALDGLGVPCFGSVLTDARYPVPRMLGG